MAFPYFPTCAAAARTLIIPFPIVFNGYIRVSIPMANQGLADRRLRIKTFIARNRVL